MRFSKLMVLAALMVPVGIPHIWADEPTVAQLIKEFQGDAPAMDRSAEQLQAAYISAVQAILPGLGSENLNTQKDPQQTLQKMAMRAARPGAEAERAALSNAMGAALSADAPVTAKDWLLWQLERIGRAEAVTAIAPLLANPDALLKESARRALQGNPSSEAAAALRTALASADNAAWRIALINALAYHPDPANGTALAKEAASDDDEVRSAAIAALAGLADKSHADTIEAAMGKGSPRAQAVATDSYLLLADRLAAKQDKAGALTIYAKLLNASGQVRCAAIIGLGRAGGVPELAPILQALADSDMKVRGAAMEALTLMPDERITGTLAERAYNPSPIRPTLVRALAMRKDKRTMSIFVGAVENGDEPTRVEAIKALATLGDASVVGLLAKSAAGEGQVRDAARDSLDRLAGPDVDKTVLAAIDNPDAKIRSEIARTLGMRRSDGAVAVLLKSAADTDGDVRVESLKALGILGGGDVEPDVVALLVKAQADGERDEAASAVVAIAKRIPDPDKRSQPVLAVLPAATGKTQIALINVLGRIGGPAGLDAVRAALKDANADTREAAFRAMTEWPDAGVAADLLAMAKSGADEKQQILALRGYIRVVALAPTSAAEKVKMYAAGMELAQRVEEKRQVLGGLGDLKDVTAIKLVANSLGQEGITEEAAAAAVKIAKEIWNPQAEAVKPIMAKVLEVSKKDNTRRDARDVGDRIDKKLNSK